MQQKVTLQAKELDNSMKLEAASIGESNPGMSQILNQLTSLSL
jgi:GTP-binding protein EngB required for normal cell division